MPIRRPIPRPSLCLALALAAALAGCAGAPSYDDSLRTWAGAEERELARAWGPPTRAFDDAGRRFVVYETRRTMALPGAATVGSTRLGAAGMDVHLECVTTFELLGGKVVAWSHRGNGCSARRWAAPGG